MMDLKYKLMECHTVKGVWGNFAAWWYDKIFYHGTVCAGTLTIRGYPLSGRAVRSRRHCLEKRATPCVNMHIPSAGTATQTAQRRRVSKGVSTFSRRSEPATCCRWSVLPGYWIRTIRAFCRPSSNILDFQRDFNIIKRGKDETFHDAWRVFGAEAQKAVKDLPRRTLYVYLFC